MALTARCSKIFDLHRAGKNKTDGSIIDLPKSFEIRVQNAHKHLVFKLTIREKLPGKIVFSKAAGHYGVIAVSY